jgi:hypothetical protein
LGDWRRGKCRGIEVAVKRLYRTDLDEKTLSDFKKEIEIMSKLNHPNVVLFMGTPLPFFFFFFSLAHR